MSAISAIIKQIKKKNVVKQSKREEIEIEGTKKQKIKKEHKPRL